MAKNNDPTIMLLAVMVVSIFVYIFGLGQYKLKKSIEYTPTSKAIAVAPGISEVAGVAKPTGNLFTAPFARKECVYYRTEIYKWSGSGKHRRRRLAHISESDKPIFLEDDTGKVLIMPQTSPFASGGTDLSNSSFGLQQSNLIKKDVKYGESPKKGLFGRLFSGEKTNSKIHDFLTEHYPSLADYNDKVDVEETYICEGDKLFVIGSAKEYEFEGKPYMLVCKGPKNVFCISEGDEKSALSQISFGAYAFLLLPPIAFVLCLSYLIWKFNLLFLSPSLQILALLLMYGYVLAIHVLEFFNSMIILRNQIDKARANVDALLARRSTLIPSLVEVVSVSAKHEKGILEQIAALRADAASSKSLLAIAENYPALRTDSNFLSLQQELMHTENWIAGARIYVADSINLYNTRIQSFPYLLFAPIFKLTPIEQSTF